MRPPREVLPDLPERPPRLSWPAVLAMFTAIGVLRFTYFYLDDITRGHAGTLASRLLEESTGAYAAMLVFPIIALAERWFPLTQDRWRRNLWGHAAAFASFTALHTTLMWASRAVISPLAGLGAYDYGRMPWRYFMESGEDLLGYSLFICLLTFLRVQQRLRDREVHALALARDAAEARLASLTDRLQPHFLFNALNTISSAVYEDPATADEMISRLGDLLRQSLRTGDRREVSVAEELALLRAYVAFVEMRFGDRLSVVIRADSAAASLALPAFLLQPLVENAVRHGSAIDGGMAEITVSIEREGDWLAVTIENEVAEHGASEPGTGTGLQSTGDRLRLLYGDAHAFTAARDGERFRVGVRVPARPAPAAVPSLALTATHAAYAGADR
ncbi:MAG TPA: histidine kinase [Gemmatimonadaceae bacterium]|nr:histidine kinase [Gemmatimonadaceae bacterium]